MGVFKFIKKEMDNFGQLSKILFQKLKILLRLAGAQLNQELRIDFHSNLKEKYLNNLLSEFVECKDYY